MFKMVMTALVKFYLFVSGKKQEDTMFKGWFKEMYFRELHTIFTEAFVEILIATFFTLQQNTRSPFGESVSYILAVFSALVIGV